EGGPGGNADRVPVERIGHAGGAAAVVDDDGVVAGPAGELEVALRAPAGRDVPREGRQNGVVAVVAVNAHPACGLAEVELVVAGPGEHIDGPGAVGGVADGGGGEAGDLAVDRPVG